MVARAAPEYLVSHGNGGEFGRFQALIPLACRRGDRVVIHSRRGLELGAVLCEATAQHGRLLPGTPLGQLLRLATPEDEQIGHRLRQRSQALFEDSRRLAEDLGLPLEMLDGQVSLDGQQGTLYFLGPAGLDLDGFAAALARRHDLFILLHNQSVASAPEETEAGCGEPNCGRADGHGCTNCGTESGCATGCGTAPVDMTAYFAHLRSEMERRNFTPLL